MHVNRSKDELPCLGHNPGKGLSAHNTWNRNSEVQNTEDGRRANCCTGEGHEMPNRHFKTTRPPQKGLYEVRCLTERMMLEFNIG